MPPTILVDLGLEARRHPGIGGVIRGIAHGTRSTGAAACACVITFPWSDRMIFADPADIVAQVAFHGALLSPQRRASSPFDPIVDLFVAGFDGPFPSSEMRRPLHGSISRKNVPAPEARLDLLNVIINGTMLHYALPAQER
jgi:hypothetical protein